MSEAEHDEELVKKRARAIFLSWMAVGFFAVWMMISSALDMWSAWEAHNAREQIVSCVSPEGECYQDSQARTARVVEQLLEDGISRETVTRQIIILSDWCADQPNVDTLSDREKCVNEQLELKQKGQTNE